MLTKLAVYAGPEHPHRAQKPVALALGQVPPWDGLPAPTPKAEPKLKEAPTAPRKANAAPARKAAAKSATGAATKRATGPRSASKEARGAKEAKPSGTRRAPSGTRGSAKPAGTKKEDAKPAPRSRRKTTEEP
jgi:hypothetical protein